MGDSVDEKQGQHLDPLWAQAQFLVQMLLDRATNHQPFERIAVHIAYRLTERQPVFAAGDFDFD